MVSHGNIVHNELICNLGWGSDHREVIVSWLPVYHDMGLIGAVLHAVIQGIRAILFSPLHFLQRPQRWLEAVSRHGATYSGGPNFAYDLCVRKFSEEEKAELDLSTWQIAVNGAEPIRVETFERFAKTFAPCGFDAKALGAGYGMAETTLYLGNSFRKTYHERRVDRDVLHEGRYAEAKGANGIRLLGYTPSEKMTVVVVDPQTGEERPEGHVGEIWAQGPNVASGYWRREEANKIAFQAKVPGYDEGFLRTGDLGFFSEGRLFLTGRLKDLVIIRGRNLYPHDIERTVELAHGTIRRGCSAVFSVNVDCEERLVIAAEWERRYRTRDRRDRKTKAPPDPRRTGRDRRQDDSPDFSPGPAQMAPTAPNIVMEAMRSAVAQTYNVTPYAILLLVPKSIPKTSSGKIQRGVTRERYLGDELEVIASRVM